MDTKECILCTCTKQIKEQFCYDYNRCICKRCLHGYKHNFVGYSRLDLCILKEHIKDVIRKLDIKSNKNCWIKSRWSNIIFFKKDGI